MCKANKLLLLDDQSCCQNLAKKKLNAQRDKLVERLALLEGGNGAMQRSVKCVRRCICGQTGRASEPASREMRDARCVYRAK